MRIQYTLPGIDYTGPTEPLGFSPSALSPADQPPELHWRHVLELHHPQPGDLVLAPPARPATLMYTDASELRQQWSSLLRRHTAGPAASPQEARMLQALAWLRAQEDDLQARILSEEKD